MPEPDVVQQFIEAEIEALGPFDFIAVGPAGRAFHMIEVTRGEAGDLEVRVPGRPPLVQALSGPERASLREHGFASEAPDDPTVSWTHAVGGAGEAVTLAKTVIHQIFQEEAGVRYDLLHGSHRAEHEATQKLAEVREQVEGVIAEVLDGKAEQDDDGDYLLPLNDVRVVVAPRSLPGGPTLVRVFAVTNVGITVTPEIGLLLARLNFGLAFGRFALDVERRAILFDETLLGDPLNRNALRFAIDVVSTTADEWDDRLKQMVGGLTYQELLKQKGDVAQSLPAKPGEGADQPRELGLYL